jgi:hypothetical protein
MQRSYIPAMALRFFLMRTAQSVALSLQAIDIKVERHNCRAVTLLLLLQVLNVPL